jgi:hypothetical protein
MCVIIDANPILADIVGTENPLLRPDFSKQKERRKILTGRCPAKAKGRQGGHIFQTDEALTTVGRMPETVGLECQSQVAFPARCRRQIRAAGNIKTEPGANLSALSPRVHRAPLQAFC